jgi:hypothetical protein
MPLESSHHSEGDGSRKRSDSASGSTCDTRFLYRLLPERGQSSHSKDAGEINQSKEKVGELGLEGKDLSTHGDTQRYGKQYEADYNHKKVSVIGEKQRNEMRQVSDISRELDKRFRAIIPKIKLKMSLDNISKELAHIIISDYAKTFHIQMAKADIEKASQFIEGLERELKDISLNTIPKKKHDSGYDQQQLESDHKNQQQQLGNDHSYEQFLEQLLTEVGQRDVRPTTISQIRDYSERLLQDVQRHNNPQERNEAALGGLRNRAVQLGIPLYALNHPNMGIRSDMGHNHEIETNLREATRAMKGIMREFEAYDLHILQTGIEDIPALRLKQESRELKQRLQRLLNQQRSRRSLEQLRDEAYQLKEHADFMSGHYMLVFDASYLDSATKRADSIITEINNVLSQNELNGTQSMQERQEHGQPRQSVREQHRQRRQVQRFTRQLLRILVCGCPRQRTPEQ